MTPLLQVRPCPVSLPSAAESSERGSSDEEERRAGGRLPTFSRRSVSGRCRRVVGQLRDSSRRWGSPPVRPAPWRGWRTRAWRVRLSVEPVRPAAL